MHLRTARGRIAGLIVFAAVLGITGAAPAMAAVNPGPVARPFTPRYAINTNGDIAQASNTLLTCKAGAVETQKLTGCAAVQQGTAAGDDNYFDMQYVNSDSDPATFDSSSAQLDVPAGATVLFAGLYWGAALDQGETLPLQCMATPRTGAAAANPAAAGSALLQTPGGGGYVPVAASVLDTFTENLGCPGGPVQERTRYQAFADVTSLVQLGGGGTYTIANVQAGTGADRHAGWSLVVAYQDPSQPARNLTIFDGFAQVANSNSVLLHVDGFKTPLSGDVNTQLGFVAYEGDLTLLNDSMALNGKVLSDSARLATNFFDSGITHLGAPVTTKSPDFRNQLGFDAGVLAVPSGVVSNGATSADILLKTTGDRYLPGVVWFRTDIYAPAMVLNKTVKDVNGGDVNPGDVLHYEISSTNTGQSSAYDTRIDDAIPAHTSFKSGSLKIDASPGGIAGAKSDTSGDDQAEFNAGANAVRFRVGTGAGVPPGADPRYPDGGGVIAPQQSFTVSFDVVVAADAADGTQILNTAVLSSRDVDGTPFTAIASVPAAVTVHSVPDVVIDKSHTGAFVRGQQGTFTLIVSNIGGRPTTDPVAIDDTLPAGLGIAGASGTGWACKINPGANSLHCDRGDSLASGAAFPAVSVLVNVLESAPGTVVNTGVTSGGGETNTGNNTDTDTVPIGSVADVAIVKSVTPTTTAPGTNVTYSLVVTNNGPSTAQNVTVSDPLPAGMTFVSVVPSGCGLASTTVNCSLGDLAKGQSVTITLVSGVPPALARKTRTNTATVTSTTPDSDLSNNKASATVTVTGPPPSKLHVRKTADPTSVSPGDTVTFTIVLKVPSRIDAKGVDVCDTLPAKLVFDSATGATFSKGRACWHLDLAKAGSTTSFKITAKVEGNATPGVVKNIVVATADNAGRVSARAPVKVKPSHGVAGRVSAVTG